MNGTIGQVRRRGVSKTALAVRTWKVVKRRRKQLTGDTRRASECFSASPEQRARVAALEAHYAPAVRLLRNARSP